MFVIRSLILPFHYFSMTMNSLIFKLFNQINYMNNKMEIMQKDMNNMKNKFEEMEEMVKMLEKQSKEKDAKIELLYIIDSSINEIHNIIFFELSGHIFILRYIIKFI